MLILRLYESEIYNITLIACVIEIDKHYHFYAHRTPIISYPQNMCNANICVERFTAPTHSITSRSHLYAYH